MVLAFLTHNATIALLVGIVGDVHDHIGPLRPILRAISFPDRFIFGGGCRFDEVKRLTQV
jgi:hypothetical protein